MTETCFTRPRLLVEEVPKIFGEGLHVFPEPAMLALGVGETPADLFEGCRRSSEVTALEQRPPTVYLVVDGGSSRWPRRGRDGGRASCKLTLVEVPEHATEELRREG